MRILFSIFNALFGTAQKVTAQIVIAVPTSLSVAYVSQLVFPAPPAAEARIEALAPAGQEKPLAKTGAVIAEPANFTGRKPDFAERDCSKGCEVATLKVAEAAPMEPKFDATEPEAPAENTETAPAQKSVVQATLGRIGATFGLLGTPFRSAQVQ